jgi:Rrf2 family protein
MKLNQSVAYAIHAVLRLAEFDEDVPVPCNKLAEQGKMPERYLLQFLRELSKQGLLTSTRGAGGGFMLARPLKEISLLEVIEAVEGRLTAALPLKASLPRSAGERVEEVLSDINEEVRRQLQAISLSDLLAKGKRG